MGGRGSSSGMSNAGNAYGSQYHTLLKSGNIKFVQKNSRESETLMETMTRGRVYVTVGGENELQAIKYFDNENKRSKQIDLNHPHKKMDEHTHHGYYHAENDSSKGAANLTAEERKMVDRVRSIWHNYLISKR